MTNQGVNFHLPPGGQISAAVDTLTIGPAHDRRSSVDQADRDGAHPDLLAEQPPRDLRDLLHDPYTPI
jgi:hypothetical protein